jgi:phospholipase D
MDIVPGIAHNKVMIIDEKKVITGSFNFTDAADKRNSENVIIIEDKETVKQYINNWYNRKK